jgi:uncharacterized alpha-E superfamily protein
MNSPNPHSVEFSAEELACAAQYLRGQRQREREARREQQQELNRAMAELPHVLRDLIAVLNQIRIEGFRINTR